MTFRWFAAAVAFGIPMLGAAEARDLAGTELQTAALEDSSDAQEAALPDASGAISARELDALLAPIALYPDQLLSQILMASTYPLDIIEAARWAARPENQHLKGQALADAIDGMAWDPSVKALVGFPEILKMLDADLDWMAKLGDAFVAEQTAVMDSVQRLRQEARAAGRLQSDARQRVSVAEEQILIEPASTEIVYVPIYDPRVVYGAWPYPDYPPYYLPPPYGYAYAPGIVYSFVSISPFWGWSRWDWRQRHITIIDLPRYNHHNRWRGRLDRTVWHHDPRQRGGWQRDRDRDGLPDRWENRRRDRDNDNNNWRPDNAANRDFRRPRPEGAMPGVNRGDRRWDDAQRDSNSENDPRRRRAPNGPGTQLPDAAPPLPATARLPDAPAPVAIPEATQQRLGNRGLDRDRADEMRGTRRAAREPGDGQQQGRSDERRRQQFQDRSIGAPPVSNVPQGDMRLRGGGIGDRPLTNIPPQPQTPPSYADRFSGQRGGRAAVNAFQAPAVAAPPAIAPEAAPQPSTDNFRQRREGGGQNFGQGNSGDGGRGRGRRGAPAEAPN